MSKKVKTRYSQEFKAQILKEVEETGNAALVARTHGLSYPSVASWVRAKREFPKKSEAKEKRKLERKLEKLEVENMVLKEFLKKTNQAWLGDEPLPKNSLTRDM